MFFLKSHCLYNYFNIQNLINVKLLFSALVFTINISYIITDYHADNENNTIAERIGMVKIREVETRAGLQIRGGKGYFSIDFLEFSIEN